MNNTKLKELDDMLVKHCHECEYYEYVEKDNRAYCFYGDCIINKAIMKIYEIQNSK